MSEINGPGDSLWSEPLNQRELKILGLIAEGLTNREIAQRLYLSIETIKWYNKQLYSKLGVSSRTQAVSVARQYSLLEESTAAPGEGTHPQHDSSIPSTDTNTLRFPPYFLHAGVESPPRFVARTHELSIMKTRLDDTLAGRTNFILVSGEAGRGKTSLLAEFARQALLVQDDLIVVGGSCTAHAGVGDPYLPFRDVLGLLSGDLEARWAGGAIMQEQAQRLWAFLPVTIQAITDHGPALLDVLISSEALVRRISPYVSNSADWWAKLLALTKQNPLRTVQLEQHQLFEQVTQVFRNLSASQPLLIHFDDLQWADSASLSLLFHLGRRLANNRIMVVGAYRASEVTDSHPLTPLIHDFKRLFGNIQIDLEESDPLEGQNFVDDLIDTEPNRLDKHFRERLFWYTKGHPLFTVELLRHLQESGNLVWDSQGRWIEKTAIDSGDLPVRVEAVIQQRISQLDPAWQELLSIASVEGEVFTAQVLARIQQIDEHLVLRLLSDMEHHNNLVREHSEIQVGERYLNRYQFNHFLFQQYLYQKLSRGERRWQHRSLAEALEYFYQGQTNEIAVQLAYHFAEAGAQAKATIYALIAGDRARKKVAIEEAIQFYRNALAGLPMDSDQERAETLKKLGECLWLFGQLPEALEAYESSYHIFENLADRIGAGATQRQIGDIYWELSQREKSLQHYHQALKILENGPESVELAHAISAISRMHMLASENEQAIIWGERALALAERLGAEEVIVHALNNMGASLTPSIDPERGLKLLQDSLDRALVLNLPQHLCRAYLNISVSLVWNCRYVEAEETFGKLLTFSRQTHMPMSEGVALVGLARLDNWTGHWKEMLERREEILAWYDETLPLGMVQILASTLLGRIYNDLGQYNQARQELENSLNNARTIDELQFTVPHLGQLARTLTLYSLEKEVFDLVREFLTLIERTPSPHALSILPLLYACRWLANQSDSQGISLFHDCLNSLKQIKAHFPTLESRAALAEGQGYDALKNQEVSSAIKYFRQAATSWDKLGRPYDQMRSLSSLGQSLIQAGKKDESQSIYNQAMSIIDTLAAQIIDLEQKSAFLGSQLIQEVREQKEKFL